ncbi:hypothetical protein OKW43_006761 [Paraburkholderia sp. WC7.3g]|uniref:TOPRIM nucleotidyl transferase/hydrolase domain-containing protein n=1 Tax=Paraburkholderia sp. WC7.3g TaxID=2991070 RepID=UPI003D1ED085
MAGRLILVEGIEDVAYIRAWMTLTDRMQDFRKAGCHIVPVDNKSHLLRPAIIARQLQIPVFLLFDGNAPPVSARFFDSRPLRKT